MKNFAKNVITLVKLVQGIQKMTVILVKIWIFVYLSRANVLVYKNILMKKTKKNTFVVHVPIIAEILDVTKISKIVLTVMETEFHLRVAIVQTDILMIKIPIANVFFIF